MRILSRHIFRAWVTIAGEWAVVARYMVKSMRSSWWESEYVLVSRGMMVPPRVAYAIIRAIVPGGIAQLITRQITRTLKDKGSKIRMKN